MATVDKHLNFNRTSTYVDLGPVSCFDFSGDFTIEMHSTVTYGGSADLVKPLLGIGIAGTAEELAVGQSLVLRGDGSGALTAQIAGGAAVKGVTHIGSSWRHLALRYIRQTQEIALFVNGELEVAQLSCGNFSPASTSRVALGRSTLAAGYLWGKMTEVRFFKSARTQGQIKADMFRRLSGMEDGLVSYFPLDGRSPDGTTVNGTVVARDAKVLIDPVTRQALAETRPSAAVYNGTWSTTDMRPLQRLDDISMRVLVGEFDGARSYVKVSHDAQLTPAPLTVQAWVRPTGTGRPYYTFPVVSKHGPNQGWELRAGGGRCGFLIAVNGVYHDLNVSLENDVWQVIAGVFDGTTMRLHVNGVLRASKTVSSVSTTITPYPGDMNIGRNPNWTAHCFAGQIGQIDISSTQWYSSWLCLYAFTNSSSYNFDSWGSPRAVYHMEGDANNFATGYTTSFIGTAQDVRWVQSDPPFLPSATAPTVTTPYTDLDTTLALSVALEAQRASLQGQLDDEKRAHDVTRALVTNLGTQLGTLTQTRDAINTRIEALHALVPQIETLDTEIATLEAEIQQIKSPRGLISLADFVKKAHAEVKAARQALAASGGRYAFAKMNLAVKMLPAPDGANMLFPELKDVQDIGADKLSTLNIGFEANDSMAVAAAQVEVPSVVGSTEVLARRTLASRELSTETSYQAIATSTSGTITEADRVVTQYPKAGSMVSAGTKVTIFLGREA